MVGFQATFIFRPPYSMEWHRNLMLTLQEYYDLTKEHLRSALMLGAARPSLIKNYKGRDNPNYFLDRFDAHLAKHEKKSGHKLDRPEEPGLWSAPDIFSAGHYTAFLGLVRTPRLGFASFSFPMSFVAAQGPESALEYTLRLCQRLKPYHGRAGLAGITAAGYRVNISGSGRYFYSPGQRYPGLDFNSLNFWCTDRGGGIHSVNWLTFAADGLLEQAGGRQRFLDAAKPLEAFPYDGGVLIKAGEKPELGDAEQDMPLPAYTAAYELFKPIVSEPALNIFEGVIHDGPYGSSKPFGDPDLMLAKSKAWPHRFAREKAFLAF